MTDRITDTVVLLHGIHTGPWIMKTLGRRLLHAGFSPVYFGYASLKRTPREHARALADFVRSRRLAPCHFVAHSLGGLVLRHLADLAPELVQARVVTLGTPHRGSMVARRLHERFPKLIGRAWDEGLDGRLPLPPMPVATGNISGCRGIGAGWWLAKLPPGSDGTVAQSETVLPGSLPLLLPCSHTGLLFDRNAARQTACFLSYGRFLPQITPQQAA